MLTTSLTKPFQLKTIQKKLKEILEDFQVSCSRHFFHFIQKQFTKKMSNSLMRIEQILRRITVQFIYDEGTQVNAKFEFRFDSTVKF